MSYFSKSELIRALSEVKYGIIAFRVLEDSCDAHQAVSEVELLERRQIGVKLTARGYEVGYLEKYYYFVCYGAQFWKLQIEEGHQDDELRIYETLENLLWSVSPSYRERHQAEIIARLSRHESLDECI